MVPVSARPHPAKNNPAVDGNSLWLALALMLVLEGLLPFLSPGAWRKMFAQILKMNDGQIRFFGLCSMLAGMVSVALILFFR